MGTWGRTCLLRDFRRHVIQESHTKILKNKELFVEVSDDDNIRMYHETNNQNRFLLIHRKENKRKWNEPLRKPLIEKEIELGEKEIGTTTKVHRTLLYSVCSFLKEETYNTVPRQARPTRHRRILSILVFLAFYFILFTSFCFFQFHF